MDHPNDIPRTAQCTGVHDSLVAAVIQAELLETLQGEGPFTLFAPTDQAFADAGIDLAALDTVDGKAQLTDILLSHVVAGAVPAADVSNCMTAATVSGHSLSFTVGDTVMVNGATVTTADVMTSNGIIHVIDTVLTPTDAYNDIAATAGCTGVHTSLVAALVQAELVETLQGEGPFTVFAPTDEAFAAAGIDLAALDTEEGKETLSDILLFHVYAGTLASSDITEGKKLRMVNGDDATFSLGMIETANITLVDVQTANGVIHVIDTVLTPPAEETDSGAGTSGTSDGESGDLILYISIALVIAGVVGLVVVRLIRKAPEGLDSIEALGKTDVASNQFGTAAATPAAATTGYAAQPAAAQPAYQQQAAQQTYQQQAYQPAVAQPAVAAQTIDDSALSAFYEPEPAAQTQPAQAVAQPAQAAVAQPVVEPAVVEQPAAPAAEPTVVNQWTDETGHTWRIMSDGSHRWWNGTDWQMV